MTVDNTRSPHGEESAKRLGEEFRAIREDAGASVERVESDLRIKAKYVAAMEDGDLTALPARVYAEGFVRNYAVYLGVDPGEAIARFYAENGLKSESEKRKAPKSATRAVKIDPLSGIASDDRRRSSLGTFGRVAALWPLLLVGGLGVAAYAGYDYARDHGIGGLDRSPDPVTTAEAPATPEASQAAPTRKLERPATIRTVEGKPDVVGNEAVPAEIRPASLTYAGPERVPFWEEEPPEIEPVDGPVSEIEPEVADTLPRERRETRWTDAAEADPQTPSGEDAARIAAEAREALIATLGLGTTLGEPRATEPPEPDASLPIVDMTDAANPSATNRTEGITPLPAAPSQMDFAIHAIADAWIQVEYASGRVAYTGTLKSGETYRIPNRTGLRLRTGNAGGLYIEVDGERFGPLGSNGAIMRDVPLNPGAIRASYTLKRQAVLRQ